MKHNNLILAQDPPQERYPNRFKPGTSGNPGGRPKKTAAELKAVEKMKKLTPEAVDVVEGILKNSKASSTPACRRRRSSSTAPWAARTPSSRWTTRSSLLLLLPPVSSPSSGLRMMKMMKVTNVQKVTKVTKVKLTILTKLAKIPTWKGRMMTCPRRRR